MNINYNEGADDVIVESIGLNGRPGAVNVTDSSDDIDLTFEDVETAREWIANVSRGIDELENGDA
jgi:hypothetical protein